MIFFFISVGNHHSTLKLIKLTIGIMFHFYVQINLNRYLVDKTLGFFLTNIWWHYFLETPPPLNVFFGAMIFLYSLISLFRYKMITLFFIKIRNRTTYPFIFCIASQNIDYCGLSLLPLDYSQTIIIRSEQPTLM